MKYNFVFGTIFLHNPHRIKQWVDYNVEIGVDHFCLYYHGKISFFKDLKTKTIIFKPNLAFKNTA